jgi:S1-C subfamily serine protease
MKMIVSSFDTLVSVGLGSLFFATGVSAQTVEKNPTTEASAVTNIVTDLENPVNAAITAKMKAIVIPAIEIENTCLVECINILRIRAAEHDTSATMPEEAGVEIVLRLARHIEPGNPTLRIPSVKLKEVSLENALQTICDAVGYRYSIGPVSVIVEPIGRKPVIADAPVNATAPNVTESKASTAFATSELSLTLSPLIRPDFDSAKMVLANLQQLADRKSGAEKVALLQVATVIKNVFTAEFQVASKIMELQKAEAAAQHQRKLAAEWMKPNAFGRVNTEAARAARAKADDIIKKARAELRDAHTQLILALRNADVSMTIYHKNDDTPVTITLANAMWAITERSLPADSHRPAFSRSQIRAMQQFLEDRKNWLAEAQQAEASEQYERAIQLYGRARDDASCKRCANLYAVHLEDRMLLGSAIEYYEMAGHHEKARSLRENHPRQLTEQFKVLSADELHARVAPCCVQVSHGNVWGGGVFIKNGGYILTSRNVIQHAVNLRVKIDAGDALPAQVIAVSAEYDLAIIKIEREHHPVIGFRSQEVKKGLPASWVAYIDRDQPASALNPGMISQVDRTFHNNPVYQLEASAGRGHSGSAVVDQTGRLVGLLTFAPPEAEQDPFPLAIRISTIQAFVEEKMR